ncbi:glutamate receptor 2-like isoform X1 [Portunus trituberculatus]|uniref:glutamate receptor 2-like isoform X1 n=1 Tax=Portunus trituberculatus TaxID=210409 RepID=UPI001E1CF8F6|nr:glutamate receptor 2-like isoform X1 [Portunus trituberculatus]
MARWRGVIVLAVVMAVITTVSADRPLMKMIRDIMQQRQWNHVVLLDPEDSEILSPQETTQLMADIVNSAAGSIIPLASNNTLALGLYHSIQTSSTFQGGVDGGADTGRVMYLRDPRYRSQFIAQWDEPGQSSTFMSMAGKLGFYTEQQEWLVLLSRNISFQQVKDVLADVNIYVDSEVMLCQETVESHFKIIEVWNVGREAGSHTIQQETWGFWTPATGLQQVTRENKYDRRKDLQGFHLRVATIKTMPYESLVQDRMLQNFREGYVVDVWHTLQEQLNFTYTATNTLFGSLQKDGRTWNGMVGMLQTDDADVAVAPLSITQIRSLSIDFTLPIQIVSTVIHPPASAGGHLDTVWAALRYVPLGYHTSLHPCMCCGTMALQLSDSASGCQPTFYQCQSGILDNILRHHSAVNTSGASSSVRKDCVLLRIMDGFGAAHMLFSYSGVHPYYTSAPTPF